MIYTKNTTEKKRQTILLSFADKLSFVKLPSILMSEGQIPYPDFKGEKRKKLPLNNK